MESQSLVLLTALADNKLGYSIIGQIRIAIRPAHILSLRELEDGLAKTEVVLNEAVDEDCGEYVRRELRSLTVLESLDQVLSLMAKAKTREA